MAMMSPMHPPDSIGSRSRQQGRLLPKLDLPPSSLKDDQPLLLKRANSSPPVHGRVDSFMGFMSPNVGPRTYGAVDDTDEGSHHALRGTSPGEPTYRKVRVNVFRLRSANPGKVVVVPASFPQFLVAVAEKFHLAPSSIVVYSEEGAEIEHVSEFMNGEIVFVGKRGQPFTSDRGGWCARILRKGTHNFEVEEDEEEVQGEVHSHDAADDATVPFWEDPDFDISSKHLQRLFRSFVKEEKGSDGSNRSAVISYEALREGLRTLHVELSDEAMDDMISKIDLDRSNDITESEFVMAVQTMGLQKRMSAPGATFQELQECCIYDYNATETKVRLAPDDFLKEPPRPAPGFAVRWIGVTGLHAPSLYGLAAVYGLHQLEVEDALTTNERTKLVVGEDNHLEIVLRCLSIRTSPPHNLKDEQVNIFRINNTLITVQAQAEGGWIVPLRRRLAMRGSKLRIRDASFLLYSMVDGIVHHTSGILDTFNQRLIATERAMHKAEPNDSLALLFEMRRISRQLHLIREWLKPTILVIRRLGKLDPALSKYYNDILDSVEQMSDKTKYMQKWSKAGIEEFKERRVGKMNKAMFTLAVVSSIFLPAQFLTGVYGMNFVNMPELTYEKGYYVWWATVLSLVLTILWIVKFKRWL